MSLRRTGTAPRRSLRITAIFTTMVLAVTTLAGCIPGSDNGSESSTQLYKGPIPAPASLTAFTGSVLPDAPVPPEDFTDASAMEQYQRELEAYAKHMESFSGDMTSDTTMQFAEEVAELAKDTRAGGEKAIAAWQSLLVAAGIAIGVGEDAVEVNGMTGFGLATPLEELRLLAVLGTSKARMYLTDLADVMTGAGFDIDAEELRDASSEVKDYAFSTIFLALDPEGSTFTEQYYGDFRIKPTEKVTFTAAQVSLLLRRLAVEFAVSSPEANPAASDAGSGAATIVTASAPMVLGAANDLCEADENWWKTEIRNNAKWGENYLFGKAWEGQDQKDQDRMAWLNALSALFAIGALIAKFFFLESDFSLSGDPLVRTKDRSPGERQDLTITLDYPESAVEDLHECIKKAVASVGINLDDYKGPAKGVDVDLLLTGSRLQYARGSSGTEAYQQKADDNGKVVFKLEGKAQPERLPEGAEPEEVKSTVEAHVNVEGSDLFSDLQSAANAARGGVLAIVMGAIERMQLLTFTWDVPVRDWTLDAEFDMTLTGIVSAHSGFNYTTPGLYGCPDASTNRSTSAVGQMNGKPHRVEVKYLAGKDDGEALTMLLLHTKGMSIDDLKTHSNGTEVAYVEFDYGLTKVANEPGVEPMPAHSIRDGGGCGDGKEGVAPPQTDCGERAFLGMSTVNLLGEFLYITVDEIAGNAWKHCGSSLQPTVAGIVSPPNSLDNCQGHHIDGGEIPNLDTVFNTSNKFEVSGELRCSREGGGSLHRFSFDWTLEFCRIVEGKRAC